MKNTSTRARRVYLSYAFLTSVFFWMVFTAGNLYRIQTAGLNALQLVLTGTFLELSVFLFEIPTGVVADVYSRKLSVIIGTILIGVGFFVEAGWTFFPTILLAQVLWGVGYTFTSGALQAWITDEVGEQPAAAIFLKEMQVSQLGALLGTAAGAALGAVRLTLPMRFSGAGFILLAVVLIFQMSETGFHPARSAVNPGWQRLTATFKEGLKTVAGRPDIKGFLGIGLFFGLYSEGFDRLWQVYMLDQFSFPDLPPVIWFGIISAAGMLSTAAVGIPISRWVTRHGKSLRILQGLAIVSTALLLAILLFSSTANLAFAITLYILIHILRYLVDPLTLGWINRGLDPQVRATVLSMRSQVDALGQITGGPLVGSIALRSGYRSGMLASALLLSPVLGLFLVLLRKIHSKILTNQ